MLCLTRTYYVTPLGKKYLLEEDIAAQASYIVDRLSVLDVFPR